LTVTDRAGNEGAGPSEARVNVVEWSVSELSAAVKRSLEDAYGFVRVRGEISGFRGVHSSGHCYFALKDENAKIEAVIWRSALARMRIKPTEGLEVVVTGRVTTFPGKSTYQVVVETLAPAGLGALMALLDERKKKLAAEGLFDAARKQLLPFLPAVIGVVTSPTGAVIRDILHRLADRFPRRVLVWPVKVQGDGSAEQVAAAIRGFNALPARDARPQGALTRPDLIIVARGGGSLEDLWSFNEEIVVRAAAESHIPLIAAVGHETDVTLIDFVADKRAPTPSAAAEMAVPVRADLISAIDSLARRQRAAWQRCQEGRRTEMRAAARALPDAGELLAQPSQRLDHAAARLPRALIANARLHHNQFSRVAGRLSPPILRARLQRSTELLAALSQRSGRARAIGLARRQDRLAVATLRLAASLKANAQAHAARIKRLGELCDALSERGRRAMQTLLRQQVAAVARNGQLLAALSHRGVLARGFALVRNLEGRPLRLAGAVSPGMPLDIEFADGHVRAQAEGTDGAAPRPADGPPKPRNRSGSQGGGGQGSLFG
jgi:exodeoxyribonuclease VII large subunit